MLKWLLGDSKSEAARGEDCVWMSRTARLKGLSREVGVLTEAERSVLVVALTLAALDELDASLSALRPARCADLFAKDALRSSLSRAGSVAIALSGGLPVDVKTSTDVGVDILVYGRNDTRAADDAILRFADAIGPNAHITFHLSLEDPLLLAFASSLKPMLEKLGINEDEPILNTMVTRAIANAQVKQGR